MQKIKSILWLAFSLQLSLSVFSQLEKTQFDNQVIVLDLADSMGIRTINNSRSTKRHRNTKLEVFSKKPVIFKIVNINPLRYNFFLNDELVTNFFESNSSVVANASKANGENTVKEIPAINIFNFETAIEADIEEKFQIREIKKDIEILKAAYNDILDSLDRLDREISVLPQYDIFIINGANIGKKNKTLIESKLEKYREVYYAYHSLEKKLERKISELQIILNTSSDKDIRILTDRTQHREFSGDTAMTKILDKSKEQITLLNKDLAKLNEIVNIVQELNVKPKFSQKSFNQTSTNQDKSKNSRLIELLKDFKYLYGKIFEILNIPSTEQISLSDLNDEKLKIIEFVFVKKNKAIETCILNNSLEVGKLLEEKWTEYSREKNIYLNKSSITEKDLKNVDSLRRSITVFFNYVKAWIADFALLNQSVKLDNKIFKSVHANITQNCAKLLEFLRDLDHLNSSNTLEFTSPIYDNLRNIDLIRFKVDRQDKLTTSRQTYVYDAWIKGGLKIDFSIGFLASGLIDHQYNKLPYYSNEPEVVSQDSFILTRSDIGNFNFCFGGMVNLVPRNGAKWMNVGGSVGVAYSTNQRLQVLTGLSIHFGKTERLILHAGVGFGTIKELDQARLSKLDPGTIKTPANSLFIKGNMTEYVIPEIERFSIKPFFGLSYNLSRQNSLQAVKSQPGLKNYNNELQ